jgi:hypothetical protein
MEKIETEMRENAEKLARAGRIDKADLELMGYKDKLSKERESARERLKKRLEKTTGGAAAEAPKKSTLDKIGVVVDVADKLTGQLDKLDPSKRYDVGETPIGTVAGPPKKTKRDRGSGMKVPINKISKINIIDSTMEPKELKAGKKPNPWLEHVKEFKKSNPAMKYSEILKKAKDTYKK